MVALSPFLFFITMKVTAMALRTEAPAMKYPAFEDSTSTPLLARVTLAAS